MNFDIENRQKKKKTKIENTKKVIIENKVMK